MKRIGLTLAALFVAAGTSVAAEATMMHCFAFTPNASASDADWQAFAKATNDLPGKVQGLKRVWYGKLRAPLAQFNPPYAARKGYLDAGKGSGEFEAVNRTHGVCMEFENMKAFQGYGEKSNQAHNDWTGVYNKVKQGGTTTYQILPME